MQPILPDEIIEALQKAERDSLAKQNRLYLHIEDKIIPVMDMKDTQVTIAADYSALVRGFVDIYNGSRHIQRGLIYASKLADDGSLIYSFKQASLVSETAPVADYVVKKDSIAGYLYAP